MTDWYVDSEATGAGSGLLPGDAALLLRTIITSASPGDTIWISKRHNEWVNYNSGTNPTLAICGSAGFKSQPLRIIGWPSVTEPYYAERPTAAQVAGWDGHAGYSNNRPQIRWGTFQSTGIGIPSLPSAINRNFVPYFTYHAIYVANIEFLNSGAAGWIVLDNNATNANKVFVVENCVVIRGASGPSPYVAAYGDAWLYGEGQPQVFYLDSFYDLSGGILYNDGPNVTHFIGGTFDSGWHAASGNYEHQSVTYLENTLINIGDGHWLPGSIGNYFAGVGEQSYSQPPQNYFFSARFYDTSPEALADVAWNKHIFDNQSDYATTMFLSYSQYGGENPAHPFHPNVMPSGTSVSGQVATGYPDLYPQTTELTRPGSPSSAFILISRNAYSSHGNGWVADTAFPRQFGRKGNTSLSQYALPIQQQGCWPRFPGQAYTFQGTEGIPLTVGFWFATQTYDYTKNIDDTNLNNCPLFKPGGTGVVLKCLGADSRIQISKGYWDAGPPTANDQWKKMSATIVPEISGPVWAYITFVEVNQLAGGNYGTASNVFIDPTPEIS